MICFDTYLRYLPHNHLLASKRTSKCMVSSRHWCLKWSPSKIIKHREEYNLFPPKEFTIDKLLYVPQNDIPLPTVLEVVTVTFHKNFWRGPSLQQIMSSQRRTNSSPLLGMYSTSGMVFLQRCGAQWGGYTRCPRFQRTHLPEGSAGLHLNKDPQE